MAASVAVHALVTVDVSESLEIKRSSAGATHGPFLDVEPEAPIGVVSQARHFAQQVADTTLREIAVMIVLNLWLNADRSELPAISSESSLDTTP